MNIALSVDGVLRNDTGDVIYGGLAVYRAFKFVGRVTLLTSLDSRAITAWSVINNVSDFDDIIDSSVEIDPSEPLRFRQLSVMRSKGTVDLFIDSNPAYVAEGLRRGIDSLLFSTPAYARPEFRPDAPKGVRPWGELVDEITRQQAMKAADRRILPDEIGLYE